MKQRLTSEQLLADFTSAFDALPLAAARIVPDNGGRIVMANARMREVFGASAGSGREISGFQSCFCDPGAYERWVEKCQRCGELRAYQAALVDSTEEASAYSITAVSHASVDGTQVIDLLLEPVVQKRAGFNPFLDSAGHLAQAQKIAGISTWTVDHQSGQLFWSEGIFELFGLDPAKTTPTIERFYEQIHPDDRARVEREFSESLSQRRPYDVLFRFADAQGHPRYMRSLGETEFDEEGLPVLTLGVAQDVTKSELTKATLEKERQRLQSVLDATETATWEWNVQTGEVRFSRRWAEIIGYQLEELAPVTIQTWMDHCHPDDLAQSDALLKAHFAGRSSIYSHEARMQHRSGEWIWVLDRGRVIEWTADGEPLWMYGTHQDITAKRKAEQLRDEALDKLQKLTDNVPGAIYQYQQWPDGRAALPFATKGMLDVYGISSDAVTKDAGEAFSRIHPDDMQKVMDSIQHSFDTLTTWTCEHRAIPDGKTVVWLEGIAQPEPQADGSVLWHGYIRDITDRKDYENRLRESASVFQFANEGIFVTDLDGAILDVNEAFCEITGYERSEVIGKNPRILDSGRQGRSFYEDMFRALSADGRWAGEVWNRRKDGELFVSRQTVSVIHDEQGRPDRYVSLFADITELKENAEKLRRMAESDPLTGLPNRLELGHRLAAAIGRAHDTNTALAVAYIDLDGFKEVNDQYGHPVGDQVLNIVAERLAGSFRESDILGRIGGDEFVAIIEKVPPGKGMQGIMKRVLTDMRQAITISDQSFQLSASIGLAWLLQDERLDGDQLIRQADQAMYQAKQQGRNCFRTFDTDHDHQVREVNTLVADVRRGLEQDQFVLHYQPKVNMETGEVIGAEALIRWQHPDRGLLTPYEFLPQIEGHDVMKDVGYWVIDRALAQVNQWKRQGYQVPVSCNIDGYTLLQPDFVQALRDRLQKYPDFKEGDLEIEVLETSALQDVNRVQRVMEESAALGVRFSIDDFGTGYSSLTYLKRLPSTMLKIDASFVRDMLEDPDDLSILSGILSLAKSFRRDCIAEGVETVQHGLLLLASGCIFGQGYAIARPMPESDLPAWMDFWRPPESWERHGELVGHETRALLIFVEHNAWMKQFKHFLAAPRQALLPPLSKTDCSLGRWLTEQAERGNDGLAIPESLVIAHAELHESAGRIAVELRKMGQSADREQSGEMDKRHDCLVQEFESYLNIQLH